MPEGGGVREFGTCPQCRRAVRFLYQPKGKSPACRHCLRLTYASTQTSRTPAGQLLKNPALLAEAYSGAAEWLNGLEEGRPDERKWSAIVQIFEAAEGAAIVQAQAQAAAQDGHELTAEFLKAQARQLPSDASLQERVIAQDVVKTTELMERVEGMITRGEENHVNRRGEASVVPMRVDSLSKLGNLYVTLSNLRASRAGIATEIHETRNGEAASSISQLIDAALEKSGARDRDGYTMAELKAMAQDQPIPNALPSGSNGSSEQK